MQYTRLSNRACSLWRIIKYADDDAVARTSHLNRDASAKAARGIASYWSRSGASPSLRCLITCWRSSLLQVHMPHLLAVLKISQCWVSYFFVRYPNPCVGLIADYECLHDLDQFRVKFFGYITPCRLVSLGLKMFALLSFEMSVTVLMDTAMNRQKPRTLWNTAGHYYFVSNSTVAVTSIQALWRSCGFTKI
jgi:hypothetical protein